VQLLPAGHRLLPRARDILDAVAMVRQIARDSERSLPTNAAPQTSLPRFVTRLSESSGKLEPQSE
jgi:DNA-binding transcriptional LysR family regulator